MANASELTIYTKGADIWDTRVRVAGNVSHDTPVELALMVGERKISFAPRQGDFEVDVPLEEGENWVRAVAVMPDGSRLESKPVRFFVPLGRASHAALLPDDISPVTEEVPDSPAHDVRLYGLCVHSLSDKGLSGVAEELDRIKELGCNAVWLNPTFPTARGNHGYDVCDYFGVRSDYGTIQDMRTLVEEAHKRGMRVLLDLVPNHSSAGHPYFQHALEHGERSPYRDFYLWEDPTTPRHYFHWTYLPNLNYENPQVRRMMMEAGRFWVGRIGIDGFRVDVAWGVLERRPGFWREWSQELRKINPHVVLIAEASARWAEYFEEGYDAAYDWDNGFRPAWRPVFAEEEGAAARLRAALAGGEKGFHPGGLVLRFVDNNDTEERFYTRYGPERAQLAAVLITTLPGIPLVYLGQENGAEYHPYQGTHPVKLGDDKELESLYKKLLALRADEKALTTGHMDLLAADPHDSVVAYLRTSPEGDSFVVVVNMTGTQQEVRVVSPHGFPGAGRLVDEAFGHPAVFEQGVLKLKLPAWGAGVYRLARN